MPLLRRRIVVTCLIGAGAVVATAAWALRVPEAPASPEVTLRPAAVITEKAELDDPFDPTAFDVALWHVPPTLAPSVEATPERPPPPPRLTLVAIICEPTSDGAFVLRAALHDPGQDKLLTVAAGEQAGSWRIARVTDEGVEISDGQRTTWLALRPDETGGGR